MALFLSEFIQLTILFFVGVVADEAQDSDGLIFNVNAGCLLNLLNQRRIERLAGLLELIHRATLRASAGNGQNPGRGG